MEINYECLEHVKNIDRELNIIRTNHPYLGVSNNSLRKLSREIIKSDYKAFLKENKLIYHEDIMLYGYVLNSILNFDEFVFYLKKYLDNIDSWAHTDILKFRVKNEEKKYLMLSKKLVKSPNFIVRRLGVRILFNFYNDLYINDVFKIIDSLNKENDYYVNMCIAWLLCELFIKNRENTYKYLLNNKINDFVRKKCISKCRDSFRVSKDDKILLKSL